MVSYLALLTLPSHKYVCFSCISRSCMPIVYYKVTVVIKPCFNYKSARYTNKDQTLKIGQTLDISDPNPVWTKIGHPKFFRLGLGWYWSENLGKMTPLPTKSLRVKIVGSHSSHVIKSRSDWVLTLLLVGSMARGCVR